MSNLIYYIIIIVSSLILILILPLMKKKADSIENVTFIFLLGTAFVSLVTEIISFFIMLNGDASDLPIYSVVSKILFFSFASWMLFFIIYYLIVSIPEERRERKGKMVLMYSSILIVLLAVIFVLLPVQIVYKDSLFSPVGVSSNFIYILVILCSMASGVLIILNRHNFKNKKYWALLFMVLFYIIVLLVDDNYIDILIVNPCTVLLTFLMFYTIDDSNIKLIANLNEAKIAADKANTAKSDFLSNMSHEIRTPLNAVVGFSNALNELDGMPDEAHDDVENIILASQTLLEIVNGILDISKIEANKLELINGPYKFVDLFNELVALTKARMGDKPLEFRYEYDKNIPEYLFGDKQRVKQVTINLLTNAVKYTQQGYVEFRVNCVTKDNNVRIILEVEDSGIGVKEENYDKLFSKFDRIDEDKNAGIEGTGLGLAITKKLVELMNGKINVKSVYGQGSTFTISIDQDYVKPDVILKLREEEAKKGEIKTINLKGKRVLLVDDNNMNLKVAERLLRPFQLDLDMINSGVQAIEKVKAGEQFELILVDDLMPRMTGVETMEELRKIDGFKTPVVILTANAISGMKEEYLKKGFDDYLSKPIEKPELERVLKKFLNK